MRLSSLKSAEYPDTEADRGLHEFTYALYVHSEPWYESDLISLAWDLNAPLIVAQGTPLGAVTDLVKINAPGAALDAIKKSEDGKDFIIRFHEMHGARTTLKVEFAVPLSGWAEANLMEEPVNQKFEEAYHKGTLIERELHPFEIVTFRVKL
jgi:alpha-mannosidase